VDRHPETGRDETEQERVDRNFSELLGELRVALPGVQVLFAFLLVVPFNQRFAAVTNFQEKLYLATLLFAAGASVCLIAPTVHHRVTFRTQDKEYLVKRANELAIAGSVLLAVAMTGAIWLATGVIFGNTVTAAAVAGVAAVFAVIWYVLPLLRLLQQRR
jgi:Family of unknown function (DUF6328)